MRIWVVLLEDTHTDAEPYPFSTPEAAVAYAWELARANARDIADAEVYEVDGWTLNIRYGESSSVSVREKTLDVPA